MLNEGECRSISIYTIPVFCSLIKWYCFILRYNLMYMDILKKLQRKSVNKTNEHGLSMRIKVSKPK